MGILNRKCFRPSFFSVAIVLFVGACVSSDDHTAQTQTQNQTKPASAASTIPDANFYRFATKIEAAAIITRDDEHFAEIQAIEIGIRNRDAQKTSLSDLKASYADAILPWTEEEKAALRSAISELEPKLRSYARFLPDYVLMAKIPQDIEGGLSHTRSNLILFGEDPIKQYFATLKTEPEQAKYEFQSLFLHELHHVLSRHNVDRHDAYFGLIGFDPCTFEEPPGLRLTRLTNPDAPSYYHYAPLAVEGGDGVIPYLQIAGPYSEERKGTLGNYFQFGFLPVTVTDGVCTVEEGNSSLLSPADVPGFFDLIGRNTGYIIHPEETLADNFSYLLLERDDLPNPEIPEKIQSFWVSAP